MIELLSALFPAAWVLSGILFWGSYEKWRITFYGEPPDPLRRDQMRLVMMLLGPLNLVRYFSGGGQ